MLVGFRAQNVRSFRDEVELSMRATGLAEAAVARDVDWRRASGKALRLLPVAGVFGANASGKTNLVRAMDDLRSFVLGSFRQGVPGRAIPRRPFLFADPDETTRLEVDLVLDGVRYEYGFVVDDAAVREEWAFWYPEGRAARLFTREGQDVELGSSLGPKSKPVLDLLRDNALFLSTAAATAHRVLTPLFSWFERNLLLAQENNRTARQAFTESLSRDDTFADAVIDLLRAADMGVTGLELRTGPDLPPSLKDHIVQVVKGLFDEEDVPADLHFEPSEYVSLVHRGPDGDRAFDLDDESRGTLVWLGLVGPILDALRKGYVLLADELDASLHPDLVRRIVGLFQDAETNPNRAQLIFNSHDVTLLGSADQRALGRDQIWFTEKSREGASRLVPLSDMEPRRQEAVGRRYLAGRYGGVPSLTDAAFRAAVGQLELVHER